MMEDKTPQQPVLTDLLIYPTSRCNLKCRHCYFAPSYDERVGNHPDEISYEQICWAIDETLPFGLRAVKLSGGEPFLREDLTDICWFLNSKGIRVIIETNGTLVTKHQSNVLGQLRGDTVVAVSVDGARAETHEALRGVKGCFRRTLHGLEHLVRAGLNVQVMAAAHPGNRSELTQTMDLAASMGVRSFKVCFVSAAGRAKDLPLIGAEETLAIDQQLTEHSLSAGIRYYSSVPVGLQSATHLTTSCQLNASCNITSTLGFLSDGTITICGMGRHAPDYRFGKLGQDDLTEVWTSHPALKTIREGIPKQLTGVCGRCIARSTCLGHCRLKDETATLDNLFDPYPVCAEMENVGLFPESRIFERAVVEAERVP